MNKKHLNSLRPLVLALVLLAVAIPALADTTGEAIIKAAYHGQVTELQNLLQQKFDPDSRDSYGGTALHAAMFQDNLQIVKMLLAAGYDPNAIGPKNGYTPLHDAVWANNTGAAKLLLAAGARTDIKGLDGQTPLAKAEAENKTEMVKILQGKQQ